MNQSEHKLAYRSLTQLGLTFQTNKADIIFMKKGEDS